ncbi:GyrI-like domain-containing protein [candidate division KSB1 bacterium]|nr:GyrI-like domain-containing protein [candidate division KSB1 bacterium]
MQKIDYKKALKNLYNPGKKAVEIVEVPPMNFLMLDGMGDPNQAPEFQHAVEALFRLAYTLKFMVKKGEHAVDYAVMPLEGLWWLDDMSQFSMLDKSNWQWTLMIQQPQYVTAVLVEKAREEVQRKKSPVALAKIRFESFTEGKAAQIMHLGPFSAEGPTVEKLHRFIEEIGAQRHGKHHEIYLSDIRKGDPAKWKTVIRQPIQ